MISFIVIGKNEGWKLLLCIQSILNSVQQNSIADYEILYIDSQSTDGSIEKVRKRLTDVRIFSITGPCNAAIARNIGGKEAKGDVLFFLDGDMELQPSFVASVFDERRMMIHPAVTGGCYHWLYDKEWNFVNKVEPGQVEGRFLQPTVGGFFVIERGLWSEMNGMDTRLTVNEDYDLGLRIAQSGVYTLNIGEVAVIHHTLQYQNKKWSFFLKYRYSAFFVRKHFFDMLHWKMSLRMHYSSIVLLISLIGFIFFQYSYAAYLFVLCLRSVSKGVKYIPKRAFSVLLRDITFLIAFFSFYPSRIEESYRQL